MAVARMDLGWDSGMGTGVVAFQVAGWTCTVAHIVGVASIAFLVVVDRTCRWCAIVLERMEMCFLPSILLIKRKETRST